MNPRRPTFGVNKSRLTGLQRRMIVQCDVPEPHTEGDELFKHRPCVVLSERFVNDSGLIMGAPITTSESDLTRGPHPVFLSEGDLQWMDLHTTKDRYVLIHQMRCLAHKRITSKGPVGMLSANGWRRLRSEIEAMLL